VALLVATVAMERASSVEKKEESENLQLIVLRILDGEGRTLQVAVVVKKNIGSER
jgi:hypothetical protein